jgi:hypothetical protein
MLFICSHYKLHLLLAASLNYCYSYDYKKQHCEQHINLVHV